MRYDQVFCLPLTLLCLITKTTKVIFDQFKLKVRQPQKVLDRDKSNLLISILKITFLQFHLLSEYLQHQNTKIYSLFLSTSLDNGIQNFNLQNNLFTQKLLRLLLRKEYLPITIK